jgi:7,8-dihydropterin-6-yl-methyl-4-(beta-D-ribofuranosyl)aminobenzene 5'-phosphate synthase
LIKELSFLENARVTILAEDTIGFDLPLEGRFGLSMLLEAFAAGVHKQILFDTNSAARPIIRNARVLHKNLNLVDTLFLSHCHYDHSDGLPVMLEAIGHPLPVISHPTLFRLCFEINPDGLRHIGLAYSRAELEAKGAQFLLTDAPLNLMTGVAVSGEVARQTEYETLEDLYTIKDGNVIQDHERDDMAVILNSKQGLVILTGCSHSGIVNIILTSRRVTGVEKIFAVIGGLHFIDASQEKISQSISFLKDNVQWVFAGHCTGFDGCCMLRAALGERFKKITTGMTIIIDSSSPKPEISIPSTFDRDEFRTLYA